MENNKDELLGKSYDLPCCIYALPAIQAGDTNAIPKKDGCLSLRKEICPFAAEEQRDFRNGRVTSSCGADGCNDGDPGKQIN